MKGKRGKVKGKKREDERKREKARIEERKKWEDKENNKKAKEVR